VGLVLAGIVSVQVGAALSKGAFDEASPTTLVWVRLAAAALVMLAVVRPRFTGRSRQDLWVALAFGGVLALMNWSIYQSFARIPLGLAVAIELLGPLSVALLTSRRRTDVVWVLLAGGGVALLGFERSGVTLSGVLFALLAAACWGLYILLSAATGRAWPGLSGLAVASAVGAVVLGLYAVPAAGDTLLDPSVLVTGAVAGLLSSVVPYSLELVALRTIPTHVFGTLMSLEPAAGALAGLVMLGESLGPGQWAAVACIVVASAGAARRATRVVPPD
jgi:inner membrane transporter RhtA